MEALSTAEVRRGEAGHGGGVDGDGERADAHAVPVLERDVRGDLAGGCVAGDVEALAASQREEVARVGLEVETDEIGAHEAADQFFTPGQLLEQIR